MPQTCQNINMGNNNTPDFHSAVAAFIENVEGPRDMLTSSLKENSAQIMSSLAPLMVPHFFWRASISLQGSLQLSFNCLLDNGSHLVLICKSLVKQLGLCCQKLHLPIETELTMQENDKKVTVTLYKYVHKQKIQSPHSAPLSVISVSPSASLAFASFNPSPSNPSSRGVRRPPHW